MWSRVRRRLPRAQRTLMNHEAPRYHAGKNSDKRTRRRIELSAVVSGRGGVDPPLLSGMIQRIHTSNRVQIAPRRLVTRFSRPRRVGIEITARHERQQR